MASLALAAALPIGALAIANRFDNDFVVLAAVSGLILVATAAFLAATKRRAGVPVRSGGLALPALVSATLIAAAYVGVVSMWDDWRDFESDVMDALLPLGLMAAATFIIIYTTLSMARR